VHLDDGERPGLWFVDLDRTPVPRRLAESAFRPQWSPDGERVFFLGLEGAAPGGRVVLRSCRPDGSDAREHAPGPEGSVGWYAVEPSGRSVYYLRDDTHELFELDLKAGRAAKLLEEGLVCRAAALDPAGRLLAAAVESDETPARGLEVRLYELPGSKGQVRAGDDLAPAAQGSLGGRSLGTLSTPRAGDVERGDLTLMFRPGGKELLALFDPPEEIEVLPLSRGRPRRLKLAAGGRLVMSCLSPDGRHLHLTTVADGAGTARFTSRRVELDSGKAEVLLEGASVLVGGPGWAPGGLAAAELTPMGLRVWAADGRWERLYPVSADEYALAAESRLNAGEMREALAYVARALEEPGPGADRQRLGLVESDAHAALGDLAEAARSLLRAYLLSPVSEVEPAEIERRMKALKGEDRLVAALERALRLPGPARAKALAEAIPLAGDPRLVAGLSFRIAETQLALGNAAEASKRWRFASETPEFPAADYAAGLAALAQFVWGRNDRYAEELMLKAVEGWPLSPLQDDLRAALAEMRKGTGTVLRRTSEESSPAGAAAWVTVRSVRSVEWALRPRLADRKLVRRRIVLRVETRSSLEVAPPGERSREILSGLAAEIGGLAFSPEGARLAFLAKGHVGGSAEPEWAAAFVVDLAGEFLLGDKGALLANEIRGDAAIEEVTWEETGGAILLRVRPPGGAPIQRRIEVPQLRRTGRGSALTPPLAARAVERLCLTSAT